MRNYYICFICIILLILSVKAFSQNVSTDSINRYFYSQTYVFPQEKIYAQTDRSDYLINDTIWFRAYLVNAQTHRPDSGSNFVYAELVNSANDIIERVKVRKEKNVFAGYIPISQEFPAGTYQLRFYTSYMTNLHENYFFRRNIHIGNYMSAKYGVDANFSTDNDGKDVNVKFRFYNKQTFETFKPEKLYINDKESNRNNVRLGSDSVISIRLKPSEILNRSILIEYLLNGYTQREFLNIPDKNKDFSVSFFPEGGSLLQGATNKIAFKATNSAGLGENITGYIVDNEGDTLNSFRSTHLGMGIVTLKIDKKEPRYALCTNSAGEEKRIALPTVENNRIALRADWRNNNLLISLNKPLDYLIPKKLYFLLHCRGTVVYSETWNTQKPIINFSGKELPSGVLHALLLDENLNPLSERLVFNKNVSDIAYTVFTTEKERFNPREHVMASVSISNSNGQSLSGSFSVAITDNWIISPDSSINILSTLLLTSDLQGYIESPAEYFNSKADGQRNLDILMMTQGWRRYDVSKILKRDYEYPLRGMEVAQEISGKVFRRYGKNRKAKDYLVTLFAMDHAQTTQTATDENGHFVFRNLSFPDSTRFIVQSNTQSGGNRAKIEITEDFSVPNNILTLARQKRSTNASSELQTEKDFYTSISKRNNLMAGISHYQLQEFVVTGHTPKKREETTHWATSEFSQKVTSEEIERLHPSNMLELLMLTPGLAVNGDQVYISRYYSNLSQTVPMPTIIVDGVITASPHLNSILPQNVKSIEVLKEPLSFALGPKGLNGAILITTKQGGSLINSVNTDNLTFITPLGYQITKEFYSPCYDTEEKTENKNPDERTTIYWNPNIQLTKEGKGFFEFYTSDSDKGYSVTIEGITDDGKIIQKTARIF